MLNSVSEVEPDAAAPHAAVRRTRLTHDDRRRQLLGIGLSKLVYRKRLAALEARQE